jgi:hypothetical protein
MPYPLSFTKLNPDNKAVNSDKGVLLNRSLYKTFYTEAKLETALTVLEVINEQNLILYAYKFCNKVISARTAATFLEDMVDKGYLIQLSSESIGIYYGRTAAWKRDFPIAAVKIQASEAIATLKERGFTK